MDKNKQVKSKQQAEKQANPEARPKVVPEMPASEPVKETDPDNPFDFGGLPARDLKKNLGCG